MNPVPEMLPREIQDDHLRQVLSQLALGLERTVNFGTHALKWFADVNEPDKHRIVFAMLLRQYLELLDAVSILVRHSSTDPCKAVVRSMFEVFLALEYILQDDTKNRACAFAVAYLEGILAEYRAVDASTTEGQARLRKLNASQRFPVSLPDPDPSWLSYVTKLQEELSCGEYKSAREEYQKARAKRTSRPRWYTLFGGPSTIEQLASRVRLSALYEVHYRSWSSTIHGTDIFANRIFPDGKGNTQIVQLRYVGDAQQVCSDAFTMSLNALGSFVSALIPEHLEDYRSWFQTVAEYGIRVNGPDFINVTVKPKASGG